VAAAKLDAWFARDNVRVVREKDEHWETLKNSARRRHGGKPHHRCASRGAVLSYDAVLVSTDTDFARFNGLRWENPLQS
jgi:uncharacterized protein